MIQGLQSDFGHRNLNLAAAVAAGKDTSVIVVVDAAAAVAGAALRIQALYAGRRCGPSGRDSCRTVGSRPVVHC